jgi:hypothetical protein
MGPAVMAVAMVVSAAGAAASGVAASNQADYQAQVAKNQADLFAKKAQMQQQDNAAKLTEQGLANRAMMGKMEASLASGGLSLDESNKGVLAGARELSKTEAYNLQKAGSYDVWATKQQQTSAMAESELQKGKSEMALYTGAANTANSLLGNAGKAQTEYGWFSQ